MKCIRCKGPANKILNKDGIPILYVCTTENCNILSFEPNGAIHAFGKVGVESF